MDIETMRTLTWPWEGKIGAAIALLLVFNAAAWYAPNLFEPEPYSQVEIKSIQKEFGRIDFIADFVKDGCEFVRLDVVGFAAGSTTPLKWTDGFGLPPDHDREAGTQTLNISWYPEGVAYQWYEVRTRHNCEGKIVDKIFAHIDMSDLSDQKIEGLRSQRKEETYYA